MILRTILLSCLLASATAVEALAQSRSRTTTRTTAAQRQQADSVEAARQAEQIRKYINEYKFSEAENLLQQAIKRGKVRKTSTQAEEKELLTVQKAKSMIQATEQVMFVDSFVIEQDKLLSAIKLSRELGTIEPAHTFLSKLSEKQYTANSNGTVYINEFGDKAYFPVWSEEIGNYRLYGAEKIGDAWTSIAPLRGLDNEASDYNYPYMLSDGITLYFGTQSDDGLGGYDIYVTRYNSGSGQYVLPENLGMPFNSPANDYLYVVDELHNLGWFATDRRQPPGMVCVYVFVPNAARKLLSDSTQDDDVLRRAAMLHSIELTQDDTKTLNDARRRLAQINDLISASSSPEAEKDFIFIINDNTIYHRLSDFKNTEAKKLATEWKDICNRIATLESTLDAKRTANKGDKNAMIAAEEELISLNSRKVQLERSIRQNEFR